MHVRHWENSGGNIWDKYTVKMFPQAYRDIDKIYEQALLGTLTDDKIFIGTTALDEETDSHLSKPDEKVTIVDTVEYEGLKVGKEYKLVGTLMDQETGEPILIDGKKVTAEKKFKAKRSTGTTEVTFVFNGSSLKGKTVVVFEELYLEDLLLTAHADIEDEDQTIHFPEIGTTAKDSDTEENIANADKKSNSH